MKRILLCAALIAWSGLASAVVYKWVDAQGKVQYGDRPPDGVHAEVVTLLGSHVARAAAPKPAETARAHPAAANPNTPPAASDPAKKAVNEDVAAVRQKQCAAAQDRYKKDIDNWRLFRTGDNGERVYLNSEEIDTERVNAKRDVDNLCGPPS